MGGLTYHELESAVVGLTADHAGHQDLVLIVEKVGEGILRGTHQTYLEGLLVQVDQTLEILHRLPALLEPQSEVAEDHRTGGDVLSD